MVSYKIYIPGSTRPFPPAKLIPRKLSAHLHSPGSADNEDDSGVTQHRHQGDRPVEHGEKDNHAGLEITEIKS